ncbi:MAG: hypothetical protein K8I27_00250 [Planctomycetes bacterium]|nr:hypothetical protein [Planctomycetota bacterium]
MKYLPGDTEDTGFQVNGGQDGGTGKLTGIALGWDDAASPSVLADWVHVN